MNGTVQGGETGTTLNITASSNLDGAVVLCSATYSDSDSTEIQSSTTMYTQGNGVSILNFGQQLTNFNKFSSIFEIQPINFLNPFLCVIGLVIEPDSTVYGVEGEELALTCTYTSSLDQTVSWTNGT